MQSRLIYKLLAAFLLCSLVTVSVIGFISYRSGKQLLEERSFLQLTAVKESKAQQIESYFGTIRNQALTMSENRMIVEAMRAFKPAFHEKGSLPPVPGDLMNNKLGAYYVEEFYSRLTSRNGSDVAALETYIPKEPVARHWQYRYIADNENPTGEKHELFHAGDKSEYSRLHEIYHPNIKSFLEKFGYYDIFLVDDKTGHIVYSVYKEVDFATSLLTGPYKDTNFAEVFREVRNSADKDRVLLSDFKAYDPSYRAPASFIASPIFDGDERVGVLVFQMPVDEINAVLTSNEKWEETGLGASGETYMVGEDRTMRSISRFLVEDEVNYYAALAEAGYSPEVIDAIKLQGTSILFQEIETDGVKAAQKGVSGTAIIDDYRGVEVLSSYRPLSIDDVSWYLLSEIDTAEAFAPISDLFRKILLSGLFVMGLVAVVSVGFARSFVRPIDELKQAANKVASGDSTVRLSVASRDEIGQLTASFNVMVTSIRESDERVAAERVHTAAALKEAEAAKAKAEGALGAARDAKLQAEKSAAKALADQERAKASEQEAERAMKEAMRSKTEAEEALAEVGRSKQATEKALQDAELANKDALRAQAEAEESQAQVEGALKDAQVAQSEALAAKARAEASKEEAEQAMEEAMRSKTEAEEALAEADRSKQATEKALKDAERANREARRAQADVEASKAQVEGALKNAQVAQSEALVAKERAEASKEQAEQAMQDIARAQAKALEDQQELNESVELMLEQIQRFAEGDLTVSLPNHQNFEINRLYAGFNQAVQSVRTLIEKVNAAVSETRAVVSLISENSTVILDDARLQADQATGIAASAAQMTQTIEVNANKANTAAELSSASGEVARSGGLIIRDAVDTIKEISGNLNQSVTIFERLKHSGLKIGETTSLIDSIAAQTKLLALNARIEAEHAAERGAGFAVVAKEVRVLAEQTTDSTDGISRVVESVQKDTRVAIDFMGECREIADKGVALADEALRAISEIDEKVYATVTMANQIASAALEQTTTSNEIAKGITEISTLTKKSQDQVHHIVQSVERLGRQTDMLSEMVGAFKTVS